MFSIKWKIFLFLLSFCTLLLLILWLFQVVFLDSFYKSIKINGIKRNSDSIEKNIDNESLSELIDRISESSDICLQILNQNGEEIYSIDTLKDCIIHRLPHFEKSKLISKAVQSDGEILEYYNKNDFRDKKFTEVKFIGKIFPPILPPNDIIQQSIIYSKVIGDKILLINSIISPVNATISTLRYQLYFITGFMIIFSIILALIISKYIAKPIEQINESAKLLAKGKFDINFKSKGYKEICELSDTLNFTTKELSKVETLRKELLANVTHDLKTPLTLISGYAEAMRDLPDEMTEENAQIIIDETKRLTTLVNDVLDISKLEQNINELNLNTYNFTESIKCTIERISEFLRKDGYNIEFNYEEAVYITADEMKISQVFYNLLTNAVNYTGEDKKIIVKQIIQNSFVKIEVTDTGEGISEDNLPYIWDRYYKASKNHKRAVMGTGLGLSIVRKIIELHKGEYGVISTLNNGSTFWFSIKRNEK